MTPRSVRRAQDRKARKEIERRARQEMERNARHETTVSEARLTANRANAQLSTGPTSSEGKAKVSLNAVKSALTGRTVLLPGDDAADYQLHVQAFAEEYSPVGLRECDLVQSIADTWWRLKRIPCLESALLAQGYIEFSDSFDDHDPSVRPNLITAKTFLKYEKQLRNLQLQEARLFRRYEKERAELVALQQARKQKEAEAIEQSATSYPSTPTNFGFEFSTAEIDRDLASHLPETSMYPAISRAEMAL